MRALTAARGLALLLGACWFVPGPDPGRGSDRWRADAVVSVDESPFDIGQHRRPPRPIDAPVAAVAPVPASLAATIEQLKATGDPRDAYQAFRLIAKCVRSRERDDKRQGLREACQDITPVQIAARLPLVEKAATAGVHGAVTARIAEGPFGDRTALEQRPDDPLVTEWVERSIASVKAAATRDDVEAILQLGLLSLYWELDEIDRLKVLVRDAMGARTVTPLGESVTVRE